MIGADVLLKNLDMIALAGLEGRQGKWGFILEGMYLDLAATGSTPGRLLTTIDVGYQQLIAEGTVTYRLWESDRGFLELLAGVRYYWVGADLGLNVNPSGAQAVGQDVSARIVNRTVSAVRAELDRRLSADLAALPTAASDLSAGVLDRFNNDVRPQVEPIRDVVSQVIRDEIGADRSTGISLSIVERREVQALVNSYVRAKVAADIEARRAAASAAVAAARSGARAQAQQALAQAEARLAKGLEDAILDAIPNSTISDSKGWVDPIIGLRCKILLTDDLYFVARADYGGFGVSSEANYNLYGAIGKKVKENITIETGIRHMGVDYADGGFLYDASFTGPFSAVMIHF
jgi:hypothetical protein